MRQRTHGNKEAKKPQPARRITPLQGRGPNAPPKTALPQRHQAIRKDTQ